MLMFKLNLKLYFKNKVLMISTAALLASLCGWYFYCNKIFTNLSSELPDYFITPLFDVLKLSWYVIIAFMFVGYEYFSQIKKRNIKEVLDSSYRSSGYSYAIQFLILEILVVLVSVISLVYVFICTESVGALDLQYGIYIVLSILLNVFLLGNTGLFIGMAVSSNKKRLSAYIVMFLFALLSSPVAETILGTLRNYTDIDFFTIAYFFLLGTPGLEFRTDFSFVASILPYRFCAALFWIFVSLAVLLFRARTKNTQRNKAVICMCLCLSLLTGVTVLLPGSRIIRNHNDTKSFNYADDEYYRENYKDREVVLPETPQEEFSVTAYDMTLSAINQLKADVTMTVDKTDLKAYGFTLYHGYEVSSVKDQDGEKLKFTREKDFITVYSSGDKVEKINMKYKGYSPELYSNIQGLNLPGYFAYYPFAGYQIIYDFSNLSMQPAKMEKAADFDVYFGYGKKIFSNLKENEDGHFVGKSNGITFLSGFYDEINVGGVKMIVPYLDAQYSNEQINAIRKESVAVYKRFIAENETIEGIEDYDLQNKIIFVLPPRNGNSIDVIYDDHCVTSGNISSLTEKLMNELKYKTEVGSNA